MGFLRTVVKLAAVGMAANMIVKARRDGAATRALTSGQAGGSSLGGFRPSGGSIGMSGAGSSGVGSSGMGASGMGSSGTSAGGMPSGTGVLGGSGMSAGTGLSGPSAALAGESLGVGAAGSGLDSPNVAERLEAKGFSTTPGAARDASDKPFGSNSQEGSTARSPGLADFTRGA